MNKTEASLKISEESLEPLIIKEMKKLKQEFAEVKEEPDIIKKATAYLVQESQ